MLRTEIISRYPKLSTNTFPIGTHGRCFTNSGPERTISVGYLYSSPRRRRAKERADHYSEGFVRFGLGAVPGRTRRQKHTKIALVSKIVLGDVNSAVHFGRARTSRQKRPHHPSAVTSRLKQTGALCHRPRGQALPRHLRQSGSVGARKINTQGRTNESFGHRHAEGLRRAKTSLGPSGALILSSTWLSQLNVVGLHEGIFRWVFPLDSEK